MKPVRLSSHAVGYIEKRGFTREEVEETIRDSSWDPAEWGVGRLECSREFAYNQDWNGKVFATKRVRPIFVEEDLEIVLVTVYTYYY